MDPYCKIVIGNQSGRTSVASNAGKTPSWNEAIQFSITNETLVKVSVWDHDDASKDDKIGEAELALHTFTSHPWEGNVARCKLF